jgi:hypothetical protein
VRLHNFYNLLPVFILIGIIYVAVKFIRKVVRGDFETAPTTPVVEFAPPTSGLIRVAIERSVVPLNNSKGKATNQFSHNVALRMSFSQEALAIIKKFGLWSLPVYEAHTDLSGMPDYYKLDESTRACLEQPVIHVLKTFMEHQPFVQYFYSSIAADHYEQKLKNEILPTIKHAIDSASASGQRKPETFEL